MSCIAFVHREIAAEGVEIVSFPVPSASVLESTASLELEGNCKDGKRPQRGEVEDTPFLPSADVWRPQRWRSTALVGDNPHAQP